jgi:hypothetical protein
MQEQLIDRAIALLEKELDNMSDSASRSSLNRLTEIVSELREISEAW